MIVFERDLPDDGVLNKILIRCRKLLDSAMGELDGAVPRLRTGCDARMSNSSKQPGQ